MNAPRTITVNTRDFGPVTFTEPSWCVVAHTDGGFRADIAHSSAEQTRHVPTSLGPVTVKTGLGKYSFGNTEYTRPYLVVEIESVVYPSTAEQVEEIAQALEEAAHHVRTITERLTALLEEDNR